MPYYNDVPYYYGGGTYANHSSLMTGTGRTPFHTPLSRFSPHLSTISESPLNHLHRFSPISVRHARRVINTADIDVSTPRTLSHDGHRPRNRLRRDRPTIKIRSQALKDNPALREHNERHEKSVGELLMEKFFIKDKKTDGDGSQQVRLYHQVSLECNEKSEPEEREAIQKRITRRFTRRRSSTDLQLDPEQLQREATYAQVQAKVLDNLVAEEQAHIENEARRGTLIKKGTTTARGSMNFDSYYANSADSDTMTKEEEEAAAARMRKAIKKAKKKKKSIVDKPSPTDKIALDDRRSSTSSEMSTDSKIEDENNSPRPQIYKIEACNSAGDFSTIWVNSNSEDSKKDRTTTLEQFRESIRVPIPRKFGTGSKTDSLSDSMNELETQIVLPVRKPYVKDPSRNSVYLTMRKPMEKLGEKLEELEKSDAKDDESQVSLANGFADAEDNVFKNINDTLTSKDESELNGEEVSSDIKDAMLKKIAGKSEKMEHLTKKKEIHSTSNDDDSWNKRGTVILKTKNVAQNVGTKDASSKNMEAAVNSIQSSLSAFVSTNAQKNNAQIKQNSESFKDALVTKKDENQQDKKKNLEPDSKTLELVTKKDPIILKVDKVVDEEVLNAQIKQSESSKDALVTKKDESQRDKKKKLESDSKIMGLVSKKDPVISKVDKVADEEVSTNAEKNNAQIKQSSESSKDALVTNTKKDESQRNKKNLEPGSKTLELVTKKDPIISKVDKVVDEEVSTNAQIKQLESSKDALVTKKDESQRDKKKNLEPDSKIMGLVSKKDPVISKVDKVVDEEVSMNAKKNNGQIKQSSESSKDALVTNTKKDESQRNKKNLDPSSKMLGLVTKKDPIISKVDKIVDEKVSTNAQIKESESSKDALVTKKDESQRDKKKNLEPGLKTLGLVIKKDPVISKVDKIVDEEVSTNAQIKQSESSNDALVTKKNESQKDKKKNLEPGLKMVGVVSKDPVILKVDKIVDEKEDSSKILMMSHEDAINSIVTIKADGNAGGKNANSATLTPDSATCRLPKPSKINVDGNNTVEAPELSLQETVEYLANAKSVEDIVGAVDAALPGKKANKTTNLAKVSSSDVAKKVSGVDAVKSTLKNNVARRDDAAKPDTKGTTLLKETKCEVNNDRDGEVTDFKSPKDISLTKTLKNNTESVLEPTSSSKLHESSSKLSSSIEAEVIAAKPAPTDSSLEAKPLKNEITKISGVDIEKDSKDSGLSSPKSKAKLNGVESKFPFKIKTFPKKEVNETKAVSGADSSKIEEDSGAFKITKVNNSKPIVPPKKDTDAAKILKKGTSIDSPKSNLTSNNENFSKIVPKPSASVDDKVKDKIIPVKKTLEPAKFPNKMMKKKPVTISVSCEKPQEESGQLSKSTSTESIDFWNEIKAPGSPEVTRPKQPMTVTPKVEDPASPKWISSDPMTKGKSSTVSMEEFDGKKNETDVKISVVTPGSSAVGSSDVGAEEEKEKVIPESPKVKKAEISKPAALTMQKAPLKKKKNLSIAIGVKELNSTVKKAPLKRDDSGDSKTATLVNSEVSTLIPEITVPTINIVEAPKLPEEFERQSVDEEYEDPKTPTNELPPDTSLTMKISRWSNQDDLTNVDDVQTPVASEEASLAATPSVSPQSSKTKRVIKKKKGSSKRMSSSSVKSDKGTKEARGNELTTTNQQNKLTVKSAPEKQLLVTPSPKPSPKTSPKTSPRSSPRNTPSQRPLDLIRMFYTTPSALLTATPRDLSKVRRAKIKRRRHHSRTPSVSSDSTGSTTSTATTESTDASTCAELDDEPEHKRMNSTRSNDSGFDGSPRISNCDMACHKKCEKLTGNLCGLNQKLVAEALQALKRTPSQSSDNQRNSDSSDHFPSGRITPPATNLPRFKKYAVTDFNFLKVLGKGSFGKVLLAELRGTECVYAVKCLKKDVVLEDDDVECTLIERKVLTLATRHPYLCHLFCTFQTESHLFFVMEYLNGGDLMFHIQKSGRFPESRARFYAAEIWSGLNFLHKKGIVYRDLKLDNVLLDFEGHIRIADFGMCKLQIFLDRTADTFCGTPDYMAPEIIKGLKYNQAVDWWSYGILLYEMLTGQSPFSGCDEDELFWSICNERPFIPRYLSQEATDMLICLLEKDSGKRPAGHEIAMHAFFQHLPWDRLERRQLEPPFKPALDHTLDTKYFDTAFTTERPRLTPVPEQILTSIDQGVFRGFSYTNPNATD